MNNKEIAEILAAISDKELAQKFPVFHELLEIKKKEWPKSATGDVR